jgi:hypothetical protein
MPCVVFEPTIPASKRAKTAHALDRSAAVTGLEAKCSSRICNLGSRWRWVISFTLQLQQVMTLEKSKSSAPTGNRAPIHRSHSLVTLLTKLTYDSNPYIHLLRPWIPRLISDRAEVVLFVSMPDHFWIPSNLTAYTGKVKWSHRALIYISCQSMNAWSLTSTLPRWRGAYKLIAAKLAFSCRLGMYYCPHNTYGTTHENDSLDFSVTQNVPVLYEPKSEIEN